MLFDPPVSLAYEPSMEELDKDEEATGQGLDETMAKIREKTYADGGRPLRSVHAKSHGILEGELEVYGDLPNVLAQGLFAFPARYPVVMRLSTTPGDIVDDSVSTPRGLAVKVFGTSGERVVGSEGDTTQDFVLVNGPVFNAPNAKVFLANLKLLAATTDKIEGVKKVLSAAMRGAETISEAFGHKSPTLASLGGQPETHILGETFFSQLPILYGPYMAKVSVAPVSPALKALTNAPLNVNGKPDGIREAVVDFFGAEGGEWEIRVQLAIDHEHTPIENAQSEWPQDRTPYIPVGRITVAPQTAWSGARSAAVDDGMFFSPWHALAAHRPLGSIMRLRKTVYEHSARFRAERTGRPVTEPTAAPGLS